MRLLLIEDEKKVVNFVSVGLKAERFALDTALDGISGLQMATDCHYDLIILDLMLPGMPGTEVLKRLRQNHCEAPILILTASGGTDQKVKHFEAGADDYLTKPFAFAELLVRIKALLRRGPANRSSLLKVADLELDRMTQQVKRNNQRIALTTKEYALLEFLLVNQGRVFSRTMIVERVWDESFEGLTNIVDVYIRHLREKIDDPFPVKLLQTVRGVGYSITDQK